MTRSGRQDASQGKAPTIEAMYEMLGTVVGTVLLALLESIQSICECSNGKRRAQAMTADITPLGDWLCIGCRAVLDAPRTLSDKFPNVSRHRVPKEDNR